MFIGHFAVALAAKPLAPKTSLGTLLASVMFLDLLWPVFVATGLEHVRIAPGITKVVPLDLYDYPWSHSLAMAGLWSVLFGLLYWGLGNEGKAGLVIAAGVFSHWVLDWVSHRPDLLLWPKGHLHVGLGLWNSVRATVAVEASMFGLAVLVYLLTTSARDWIGHVFFWLFVFFCAAAYAGSILGPPPPSVEVLIASAFGAFLLIPWAWWFDRHRRARGEPIEEA